MTPEEAWKGHKPSVEHFRIFGCIAYAHVPDQKRKKLDDKGEKCVFLGVSEASKAYKLYNPLTKMIVTSRDVIFDEERTWEWNGQQPNPNTSEFGFEEEEHENGGEEKIATPTRGETSTDVHVEPHRSRIRKRPAWMEDFEVTGINQIDDPVTHFALFSDCDPTTFESAAKEAK
ncbi:unnamed protein product [Lupinus luteus]|uniref:Retroviral polymerase SH3-like domain-containing protein n=1 Tax=Lupinus luteus TaxID=3873 RepID=A0AAV1WYL1_LUPLU